MKLHEDGDPILSTAGKASFHHPSTLPVKPITTWPPPPAPPPRLNQAGQPVVEMSHFKEPSLYLTFTGEVVAGRSHPYSDMSPTRQVGIKAILERGAGPDDPLICRILNQPIVDDMEQMEMMMTRMLENYFAKTFWQPVQIQFPVGRIENTPVENTPVDSAPSLML